MNEAIFHDLADQTARNCGAVDADFVRKMARRMRRKFAVTLDQETIPTQAARFRGIYQAASSILPQCLQPSSDGYAHSSNVDAEKYGALLREKFPEENDSILKTISSWVVYYEYLR